MICYMIGLQLNILVPLHAHTFTFFYLIFLTITQKIKYSLSERFVLVFGFVYNLLTTDVFTLSLGACQRHISLAMFCWMEQREDVTDNSDLEILLCFPCSMLFCWVGWEKV